MHGLSLFTKDTQDLHEYTSVHQRLAFPVEESVKAVV